MKKNKKLLLLEKKGKKCENCKVLCIEFVETMNKVFCNSCYSKSNGFIKCLVCGEESLNIGAKKFCGLTCQKKVSSMRSRLKNKHSKFDNDEKRIMKKLKLKVV